MTTTTKTAQGQYLTFTLGREIFALDISKVREVLELTDVSAIPRTPEYLKGVINLRGHAVPVLDMRSKLGMRETDPTVDTCIIIETRFDGEDIVMGTMVDSVREVFTMAREDIEPAPKMGASIKADYIQGMGRQEDRFVIIVDMDGIFTKDDLKAAAQAGDDTSPPPPNGATGQEARTLP